MKSSSTYQVPSLFSRLDKDIPSGIVVFLVALPLCLGIALASGAPLITGLISGIIGGLVIGAISGSGTSVSGPAASLSAVVFLMIQTMDSFQVFLVALVLAGLIQVVLGALRAGVIADYMPTSIIKGLLAAIGIILIISQTPYALGVELDTRLSDYSQNFLLDSWTNIIKIIQSISPGAAILSAISLSLLIFWDRTPLRKIKLLPPSLFVVILGVAVNQIFKIFLPELYLESQHLVSIPKTDGFGEIFTFPDFSVIGSLEIWTAAFTIAIVASIATLLNLEATDNLDPHKRRSSPNRELIAQGVGNTLAGLIGGIPITSVIVRSSVNIETGAETKLSTLIHGALLLASVLFLSEIINLIPLATLASVLLVVGYKLASIDVFKMMYKRGLSQFLPFVVTTFSIILTDVLIGVLIGSVFSVFFLLRGNYYNPFYLEKDQSNGGNNYRIELSNEVSFLNKPVIKKTLWSFPTKSQVVIDATFSTYIEPDIIEILQDYKNTFAKEHNIGVRIIGLRERYNPSDRISVIKEQDLPNPNLSTPESIREYLMDGNKRYISGRLISRRLRNKELVDFIKDSPLAVIVNCLDMREPINMLLNTGIGDLVHLKAVGNLVSRQLVNSIEMACRKQGARLVLLMGNSENTFIKEALETYYNDSDSYLSPLINPAIESGNFPGNPSKSVTDAMINEVTWWNLKHSKDHILENTYIQEQVDSGKIGICMAMFDRESGKVDFSPLMHFSLKVQKS